MITKSKYITASEFARQVNVTRETILNWKKAGIGPKPKNGIVSNRVVYDQEEVSKFLEGYKPHYNSLSARSA